MNRMRSLIEDNDWRAFAVFSRLFGVCFGGRREVFQSAYSRSAKRKSTFAASTGSPRMPNAVRKKSPLTERTAELGDAS